MNKKPDARIPIRPQIKTKGKNMQNKSIFSTAIFGLLLAISTASAQTTNFVALHQFSGQVVNGVNDGANPHGSVLLDANGNLFGTTFEGGGSFQGSVYKIDST